MGEETFIYEGEVAVDKSTDKVYLTNRETNGVVDINSCLAELTGEEVEVLVTKKDDKT